MGDIIGIFCCGPLSKPLRLCKYLPLAILARSQELNIAVPLSIRQIGPTSSR
jgi:hypothetical protein